MKRFSGKNLEEVLILKVAIDGPAASGKSTVAYEVAKRLNFLYIDTGAMYRCVTLEVLRRGKDVQKEEEVVEIARKINLDLVPEDSPRGYKVLLNGEDVTNEIFTPIIDENVSLVAKIPEVRKILVEKQRCIAQKRDVVMAGRDIGSVVLPDAEVKIFLNASDEVRARRRFLELKEKGKNVKLENVLKKIRERDKIDSTRTDSPLVKVEDALEIDTSNLSIDEVVNKVISYIESKRKPSSLTNRIF